MNRTIRAFGFLLLALLLLASWLMHALEERAGSGTLTVEIAGGEVSWSLSWTGLDGPDASRRVDAVEELPTSD